MRGRHSKGNRSCVSPFCPALSALHPRGKVPNTIRFGNHPPYIRMSVPAHKSPRASHLESTVARSHPMVWSLALWLNDAKQDSVVYGAEFAVVFLVKGPRTTSVHYLFIYFNLTYSRWISSLPFWLWSLRVFPFLPGSRLTSFYRDANIAILQLVNKWLNFTYSRCHAFRFERKNTNPTLVRIEPTTSALTGVQVTY